MADQEVIDRGVLENLLDSIGGDREFLGELLLTFFADAPKLFGTMRAALAAGGAEEFRRAAHSLKSNSASFGAVTLSRMCKALEEIGKVGTLEDADKGVAAAEAEYLRVKAALEAAA